MAFFSELRKRKVFHVAIGYLAVAWLVVQVADAILPAFDLPGWALRLIVLLFALGFPVALLMAWALELTPEGVKLDMGETGRRRMLTVALVLAALALGWFFRGHTPTRAPSSALAAGPPATAATATTAKPAERPSLAVLPFADLSQAHDQEYLGEGLAEEILNQLASVPALRLVGRTSSFSFKGKNEDLRVIGKKLGVAYLLDGSVRRDGDQLRITAQLARSDDGTHVWSKTYNAELKDIFTVQGNIARDVTQALSVKLDAVTLNRAQGGTTNLDAYDRFLRWRSLTLSDHRDMDSLQKRIQLAREMVALDPQFVLGWDALASSLDSVADGAEDAQAEQLRAEARQARERIARIAPDNWTVKRERAYALWREGKRAEAISLAREIMDSGPLTVEHAYPYINLIAAVGHLEETVALADRVKAIEPLVMFPSRDQQFNLTMARRYAEAESEYQRSLTLDGDHATSDILAFIRRLALNEDVKALRELHRKVMVEVDTMPPFFRNLGNDLGDRGKMLADLRKAPRETADDAWLIASIADALGDADLAATALRRYMESQQGFKDNMPYGEYFGLWIPSHSSLRSHPEFRKLLVETGVVDYWRQTGKWGDGCTPVGADDFQCR